MSVHRLIAQLLFTSLGGAAIAVPVNPHSPDGVAAIANRDQNIDVLMTTGEIWTIHLDVNTGIWACLPDPSVVGLPPIPMETIREWDTTHVPIRVITTNWDLWLWGGPGEGHWVRAGAFDCLGAVTNEPSSMGDLKSLFR